MNDIDKDLHELYGRFGQEMDQVELPSEGELMHLLQSRSSLAPSPGRKRRRLWWSVAASVALLAVAGTAVLLRHDSSEQTLVAEASNMPREAVTAPELPDLAEPPAATEHEVVASTAEQPSYTRCKVVRMNPLPSVGSAASTTTAIPPQAMAQPLPEMMALMPDTALADTLAMASQQADTAGATLGAEHTIADYPDKEAMMVKDTIVKNPNNDLKAAKSKKTARKRGKKKNLWERNKESKDVETIMVPHNNAGGSQQIYIGNGHFQQIRFF